MFSEINSSQPRLTNPNPLMACRPPIPSTYEFYNGMKSSSLSYYGVMFHYSVEIIVLNWKQVKLI